MRKISDGALMEKVKQIHIPYTFILCTLNPFPVRKKVKYGNITQNFGALYKIDYFCVLILLIYKIFRTLSQIL